MKILIVDDEFVSLNKLSMLLKSNGECDAATSGEQAMEMFMRAHEKNVPYDLITLDIDMPGISGPEAARQIRKFEEQNGISTLREMVKILMVTAMHDGKSVMSSFREGCEGYLTKPFSKEEIRKSLTTVGLKEK